MTHSQSLETSELGLGVRLEIWDSEGSKTLGAKVEVRTIPASHPANWAAID